MRLVGVLGKGFGGGPLATCRRLGPTVLPVLLAVGGEKVDERESVAVLLGIAAFGVVGPVHGVADA